MSDPDPQQCNCLDGTLLCTQTLEVKKNHNPLSTFLVKAGPMTVS